MGFFSSIFSGNKRQVFTPDFSKSEYDNWLDYLDKGGTSDEWEKLIKANDWKFQTGRNREGNTKGKWNDSAWSDRRHKAITDKYFSQMHSIEEEWSITYNLNDFSGKCAQKLERECIENIKLYKEMAKIEQLYNETPPPNAPAFKRLAMLYEKQNNFEEAVSVCCEALRAGAWGDNMRSRLARMIKKTGRAPTDEEMKLMNNE